MRSIIACKEPTIIKFQHVYSEFNFTVILTKPLEPCTFTSLIIPLFFRVVPRICTLDPPRLTEEQFEVTDNKPPGLKLKHIMVKIGDQDTPTAAIAVTRTVRASSVTKSKREKLTCYMGR